MGSEWIESTLGEVCRQITDGAHQSPASVTVGGLPMASVKDLKPYGIDLHTARRISKEDYNLLVRQGCRPEKGDVLIAKDGNSALDTVCTVDNYIETVLLSSVAILKPDFGLITSDYLKYYLTSASTINYLKANFISGAAIPRVVLRDFKKAIIKFPSIPTQRAIAHILGTLDDKIELNRKRNETLEAMARALFKDCFVDFGPVRAKLEGRDPYLPAEIWDLFPDRLDEEGKPEGWGRGTLGDFFYLTMGQSPPGNTYNDLGIGLPFFQGRTDFGFRYPTNRKYCSAPTRIANPGDTLVSVRAPVGDINLAWEKCCIGRGVAAIRHISGLTSYTYHALWSIQDHLKQFEHTGTVFGAINKNQFEKLPIIESSRQLINAFEYLINPFDDEIRNNIDESRTLAHLRDALLPKLISGVVRVRDVDRFIDRAIR